MSSGLKNRCHNEQPNLSSSQILMRLQKREVVAILLIEINLFLFIDQLSKSSKTQNCTTISAAFECCKHFANTPSCPESEVCVPMQHPPIPDNHLLYLLS